MAKGKEPLSESFEYDVAISFLWQDVELARSLKAHLEPGLRVYVAPERKEETLGRDGMDAFGAIFRRQSRLSVVLYREGWGDTPFTAVEEAAIKDRAGRTHFKSLMLVPLDESELREWMPEWHLRAATKENTHKEIAAVIRARAAEVGAEVKSETAPQTALRLARERRAREARSARFRSQSAVTDLLKELEKTYETICTQVQEVTTENPELEIHVERWGQTCMVSSPRGSVTLEYRGAADSVEHGVLKVSTWRGQAQRLHNVQVGGYGHLNTSHYSPIISDDDNWSWRRRYDMDPDSGLVVFISLSDDVYSQREFAEVLVRAYFERLLNPGE